MRSIKTKPLKLEDLTKQELLDLMKLRCVMFGIAQRDLVAVRVKSLTDRANRQTQEASEKMKKLVNKPGPKARIEYLKEDEKWCRAMKLYEKADELWKRNNQENAS